MTATRTATALSLRHCSKTFGETRVLHDVDLDLRYGSIHGLIGQNGSGKSTIVKILAGYHAPDEGACLAIGGCEVPLPIPPGGAAQHGLCFVHQDLGLNMHMSIVENIVIGRGYETGHGRRIRWGAERRRVGQLLDEFELELNPETDVGRLPAGERAIVAILRALEQLRDHDGPGVLVLDEPTVFLPAREVSRLFSAIRRVAEQGAGALIVSHRLPEIQELTHRVTVIRDGRWVWDGDTNTTDEAALLRLLLGRDPGELYPEHHEHPGEAVMQVEKLDGHVVQGLSLTLRKGEILGVTGLIGMGQDELPYLLFGAVTPAAGSIKIGGCAIVRGSPRAALRAGMGLLPSDRQLQSSYQLASVRENVTLPVLGQFFRHGMLRHRAEEQFARGLMEAFHVHPADPDARLSDLSGGNQQKALLGKWMRHAPPVLVLHEPTQGVDVGARQEIFRLIQQATAAGTAILICSAQYDDLANVCDRVLVLRRGRLAAEVRGAALTEDALLDQVYAG